MRNGAIALLALLFLTHATGLVTIGLVTTSSMTPTLTQGSLFLALHGSPTEGDLVVFERANGDQAVHRVVDKTPQGLVTKGDANPTTDQAAGEPHVDAGQVNVVPTIRNQPVAVSADWIKPIAVLAAQGLAFTYALSRMLGQSQDRRVPWPLNQVRPSHLVFAAGLLLVATAPFLSGTLEASGQVKVQSLVMPTTVQVTTQESVASFTLGPLSSETVPATGPVEVVRAPALPGASALASYGAVWAMLPTAIAAAGIGVALRLEGH